MSQGFVESNVVRPGDGHQGIERGQPLGLRLGTSFQGSHGLALQGTGKLAVEQTIFPVGCSAHSEAGFRQLDPEQIVCVFMDDFDRGQRRKVKNLGVERRAQETETLWVFLHFLDDVCIRCRHQAIDVGRRELAPRQDADIGLGIVPRDHYDPHPALFLGLELAGQDLAVFPLLDLQELEEASNGPGLARENFGAFLGDSQVGQ